VDDFSREVQNDLRGGAHLPSKSGHDKILKFIQGHFFDIFSDIWCMVNEVSVSYILVTFVVDFDFFVGKGIKKCSVVCRRSLKNLIAMHCTEDYK
jgi:hypothetical protein